MRVQSTFLEMGFLTSFITWSIENIVLISFTSFDLCIPDWFWFCRLFITFFKVLVIRSIIYWLWWLWSRFLFISVFTLFFYSYSISLFDCVILHVDSWSWTEFRIIFHIRNLAAFIFCWLSDYSNYSNQFFFLLRLCLVYRIRLFLLVGSLLTHINFLQLCNGVFHVVGHPHVWFDVFRMKLPLMAVDI